jgi:hypothetical protein
MHAENEQIDLITKMILTMLKRKRDDQKLEKHPLLI